jgi:hypothetical protein
VELKYNQTVKSATLYFNLEEPEQARDLDIALNADKFRYVISEYFNALRSIRKYNSLSDVYPVELDAKTMKAVEAAEDYYRTLMARLLEQSGVDRLVE